MRNFTEIPENGEVLTCPDCDKDYLYLKGKRGNGSSRQRCASCYVMNRRKAHKERAVEYLGGKCQECGYDRVKAVLCFHHRDGAEKDYGLANMFSTSSWSRIQAELDKCDLLCANCHLEKHWQDED